MKKFQKVFAICVCASLVFAACKKTDNGPVLTPQEKILTNKIWKVKSLTMPKADNASVDSSILPACGDSAMILFDVFKAFQLADGSKGCDSVNVPYEKGNWKFSTTSDSLLLTGKRSFVWKIEKLNDTIVKATFRDSISPTKNWLKTITLK
jgi:hypothetical protein